MNANKLFRTAGNRSRFLRREESAAFIEPCLDQLARMDTFRFLGVSNHEDIMECVGEMRAGFDTLLHHYIHHGRSYLPCIPTTIAPPISWFFVALYIASTRGHLWFKQFGPFLRGFALNTQAVVRVSNRILDFVHDPKMWENGEEVMKEICRDLNLKYNPIHMFPDADDVLAIANLVGFRRAEVVETRGFKVMQLEEDFEEVTMGMIPPNIFQLLSPEESEQLKRAYLFNADSFEALRPYYITVQVKEGVTADVIRLALTLAGCLSEKDHSIDTMVDIDELIAWCRKGRLDPIPLLRSEALSKRMKDRFGFGLIMENNNEKQTSILNMVSVFALSLYEADPSLTLN